MPTVNDISNADPLDGEQFVKLRSAIRASEVYQSNRSAYPDIDTKLADKVNRKVSLTGATNASPIVITSANHGFLAGDFVTIQNVGGNTAANGVWLVKNPTTNTLELTGTIGSGSYTSGGEILDLVSQHLAAIVAALDANVGDGTVGVKGGKDGTDYSQERDRESLVKEALATLYDISYGDAIVVVGQRGAGICPRCHTYWVGPYACACMSSHGIFML